MSKKLLGIIFLFILMVANYFIKSWPSEPMTGAPPYGEPEQNAPGSNVLPWLGEWKRPEGPAKVALQVGHWKSHEHPEELARLRGNTGARGGGKTEWEVNYKLAHLVRENLREYDIQVEILPATVPPRYWADIFIAIHADGSEDVSKSGYKIAAPWRDYTQNADELVSLLTNEYKQATGLEWDPNITRNMRGYYAFSWWRYEHAIHPMTTAAIVETGFLTNYSDRQLLIGSPEVSAEGISNGILRYLQFKELI